MKTYILILAVTAILMIPSDALACACCAENGTYSTWTGRPSDFDLEVIGGMDFGKEAKLIVTEAEFEAIKGLDALKPDFSDESLSAAADTLDLVSSFTRNSWTLNLVTKSGKKGSLILPMPTRMTKFKVDIHDNKIVGAGGPLLYKEFRFKGYVRSGSGFFKRGIIAPTGFSLIFQGRGNGCDNTEDFSHWRLEIGGSKARYAFFGKLASGPNETAVEDQ